MGVFIFLYLSIIVLLVSNPIIANVLSIDTKYFQTPMHEIMQTELYLSVNNYQEIIVSYSGKGTDMRTNDYITHADGIRILTGGLDDFMKSVEKEAVLPVIDEDDFKYGGYRLKGFMLLQSIQPRKLSTRRGDIYFDLEEGGPAPAMKIGNIVIGKDGPKITSDPNYQPPPHGGGSCLSHRDCFYGNGTCTAGHCGCLGSYTGTYCQLYRPEYAAVTKLMKKNQQQQQQTQKDRSKLEETVTEQRLPISFTTPSLHTNTQINTNEHLLATASQSNQKASTLNYEKDALKNDGSNNRDVQSVETSRPYIDLSVPSNIISNSDKSTPASSNRNEITDTENGVAIMEFSSTDNVDLTEQVVVHSEEFELQTIEKSNSENVTENINLENNENSSLLSGKRKKKRKAQPLATSSQHDDSYSSSSSSQSQESQHSSDGNVRDNDSTTASLRQEQQQEQQSRMNDETQESSGSGGVMDNQRQKEDALNELYGEGKAYPEPYAAGKLPNSLIHERYKKRFNRETFIYSIRFRVGPFGITFDNKHTDKTVVQKLAKGEQAELSDIKEGDRLIAVDNYNVTSASAKSTQRLMSQLSWPRVLVFEVKATDQDPRVKELELLKRTFNINIVYPPSLVSEFQIKLSEWGSAAALKLINVEGNKYMNPYAEALSLYTPLHPYLLSQPSLTNNNNNKAQFCPIYRLKTAADLFGCKNKKQFDSSSSATKDNISNREFSFPHSFDEILENSGNVNGELELESQLLTMLVRDSKSHNLFIEPRSAALAKRGDCTFIEKARSMQEGGATLGIVVNSDNELIELPTGREKTTDISLHIGIVRETDASLALLAGSTNEIWAIITEATSVTSKTSTTTAAAPIPNPNNRIPRGRQAVNKQPTKSSPSIIDTAKQDSNNNIDNMTPACAQVMMLVEDIIDKWPHSVPQISTKQIMNTIPPDKVRGLTEEGGRLALSGQNGWAFFDYHLAMFGPQDLPLGPFKLQMALPPFGCDPASYNVRIQGTVVAILRGGSCSFGIKVINAQKLGAKAVIIVNTDDMKTMRLMALPDEVPLINIPCIMVSRRIQFYLEQQLRSFYPIDQHIISMQPTGIFGEYEKRNQVVLPQRI